MKSIDPRSMKSINAKAWAACAAAVLVGCSSPSAPANTGPTSEMITIGIPATTVDTTGESVCTTGGGPFHTRCTVTYTVDSVACPTFSPSPASAATGQSVQWFNNSGSDVTLFQQPGHTPIVTISAGATSSGVYWSQAGTIQYEASSCAHTAKPADNWAPPTELIYITVGS